MLSDAIAKVDRDSNRLVEVLYRDARISRAAPEIEPALRILSSSLALPGPIRAPDSKTMLTRNRAMAHCAMRHT